AWPGRFNSSGRLCRSRLSGRGPHDRHSRRVHTPQRANPEGPAKSGVCRDGARAESRHGAESRLAGRRDVRSMIARIWSIMVKEFIQVRRDPRTLAIVLVMPIMQLVLFGYAINTAVDHIATIVLDQSRDAQSRR